MHMSKLIIWPQSYSAKLLSVPYLRFLTRELLSILTNIPNPWNYEGLQIVKVVSIYRIFIGVQRVKWKKNI